VTGAVPAVDIVRCSACQGTFLPRTAPCPRCGNASWVPIRVPNRGRIFAATELEVPPEGYERPHRLAIVELAEGARLLARVDGPLPVPGAEVELRHVEGGWRASVAAG
jgi:uncharacterized OB-fold protein